MSNKALVVIDIQNDITKHYRDIIDSINAAIDWAVDAEDKMIGYVMVIYDYCCLRNPKHRAVYAV